MLQDRQSSLRLVDIQIKSMEVWLWCNILVRDNSSIFMLYTSRTSVRLCYNYWIVNVMYLSWFCIHALFIYFKLAILATPPFFCCVLKNPPKSFYSGLLMFWKLSSYSPCSIKITIYFYGLELNKNWWASLLFLV